MTRDRSSAVASASVAARLATRGVGVRFVGVHALDNVDAHVGQGEIVGLIGPNGAGKTTLVNVLSGFQRPSAGSVWFNDRDVTRWPAHRRARGGVSRTFQSVRPFRGLTVRENVEAAAFATGASRSAARDTTAAVLSLVGLSDIAEQTASAVSYGQERRIGIARALASEPRILLLDEPAAGLNEVESDDLLAILSDVRNSLGCGLLVIEHDMRLIMRLCDRLHVLDNGRTISEGPPGKVAADPAVLEAYLGRRRGGDGERGADAGR